MLSYYYGEQNHEKRKKMVAASFLLARPLVFVFARPDNPVYDLAVNGIWLATPAAELMALALSAFMFLKHRKKYGY